MDWYLGRDDEDFTVPEDDVIFDRLPSPDSWPSWVNTVGTQKKLSVLGVEELLSSETMFHRHGFCQQSPCAHDHLDAQLNDLPKINEADDIFFDSLFRVDAGELDGSDISSDITQTSERNNAMAVDLGNHIRDNANNALHVSPFSPEKEKEAETCMIEERSDLGENISEYKSFHEPVLLELQNLTQQMSDTTRICFRDSLYRLAENSRFQSQYSHSRKENVKNYKPNARVGPSRPEESKAKESDTNAIDRTVATLLFTTMKYCNQADWGLHQLDSSTPSHYYVKGSGDAEVPTFDMMSQPLPRRRSRTLISRS